ncbi:hypothetical protein [Melghirimyces algeriensis]|uniref:hypothetical protein n=1 Tax=Melghirimyces algeriensis TaxID=910412 RepID=UPI0011577324|nr:hypothetical protein [Melghirimyces algeriensis]
MNKTAYDFTLDDLQNILNENKYWGYSAKITVREFLKFSVIMATEWHSYRDSENRLVTRSDMVHVDHSTLAKKATQIPYEIFKQVFHLLIRRCNRQKALLCMTGAIWSSNGWTSGKSRDICLLSD